MQVHPTAIVHEGAQLGTDVVIGPYCVVGPQVRLGDGCRLHAHVLISGDTHIGPRCEFWPFAHIGGIAQDKKLTAESPQGAIRIGSDNKFREYVTINPGTPNGVGTTTLGSNIMMLINSHIGHDVVVGDHVVMTNGAMAAGHTTIEAQAVLGALVGAHQFCRIGRLAMCAAGAMVAKDAPPFAMVQGDRARIRGVNVIGMRRAGFSPEDVGVVKRAFRTLFWRSDPIENRLARARETWGQHSLVAEILKFMEETKRGVLMARGKTDAEDDKTGPSGV